MKNALLLLLVLCGLAGVAGGVAYVLELRAATAPPTPKQIVQATWSVYRLAPGHQAHVASMGVDCNACHTARPNTANTDRASPSTCVACHEDYSKIEHMMVEVDADGHRTDPGQDAHQVPDSTRCHGFGPDADVRPQNCQNCHASTQNETPPVTVHAGEACTACHDVHANRVTPLACQSCHPIAPTHGHRDAKSASQCLDCHRAHAPAEFGGEQRCRACHGTDTPHDNAPVIPATATEGGHQCTGCHAPHDFQKTTVKACTSCHGAHPVLAGEGHTACTGCHDPHAAKRSVTQHNACLNCHGDVQLVHNPSVAPTQACTSCHTAHPDKQSMSRNACTSCHKDISGSDLTAHAPTVQCAGCHKPHDFKKAMQGQTSCTSCHAERVATLDGHAGHARCAGCHTTLPHGGVAEPVPCGTCHRDEAKAVVAGHATCTSCHDEHTGAREKTCANCHAEEAANLSKKHGPCQSCHDQHAAKPKADVATCSSCHVKDKLPWLHDVPKHNETCSSCHDVHASGPVASRATCLSCHQKHKDHQPQAERCDGCHAFSEGPKARRSP